MLPEDWPEAALDSLCDAIAADTGIPMGRVKKVLLSAQHQLQAGNPSAPPASLAAQDDPLRFHPLGANGRIHPPIQQSRTGHADDPA
jgi:hypothetical protein